MKVEAGEVLGAGRNHIITRPRLTSLLDEATARIILLVAPAGYGKTTLAREWLGERTHGWHRANAASADVAALAVGLGRTAATIVPGAADRLTTRLRVSRAPSDEVEVLAELLAEDLAGWPPNAWLALDDYHFACDSEPSERFVEHLAATSGVRFLIAGRSRPTWASARRVLYGEIYEIGRNLLSMNRDEAQSVLAAYGERDPSVLITLADGWPALLGLAALADDSRMPGRELPNELYGYFAEELYQAVPETLQEGLRRLSLAPSISLDIAKSLAGDHAAAILQKANALGFFLASSTDTVEFHPLLRSFLASKFNRERDDPNGHLISGLVRKLLKQESWDEVFELLECFFDETLLLELFEAALLRMVDEARLPTLARWIKFAKAHHIQSPIIGGAETEVAFKRGDLRRSEAIAVQTSLQLPAEHPLKSKVLWLAGTSAHLTWRDREALEYFRQAQEAAVTESDSRRALWGRFMATETLELEGEASALLSEFSAESAATTDDLMQIATGQLRMTTLCGQVRETLDTNAFVALLVERSRDPLIQTSFLNVYAGSLAMAGRYAEAASTAHHELALAEQYSLDFVVPFAQLHLAEAYWGMRNFRSCRLTIASSERSNLADGGLIGSTLNTLRARLFLDRRTPPQALLTLDRGHRVAAESTMYAEYLAWWSLAHALNDEIDRAIALADRAESMSRRVEVSGVLPWTRAILELRSGQSARASIEAAFHTSLTTGNIDAFVTAYRSEPRLLESLSKSDRYRDELKGIMESARDFQIAGRAGLCLEERGGAQGPGVLTAREREVIELVSQGLSNKEIARTLFITEATVKVHVRKTCLKFGARSRTEAAIRFSELID